MIPGTKIFPPFPFLPSSLWWSQKDGSGQARWWFNVFKIGGPDLFYQVWVRWPCFQTLYHQTGSRETPSSRSSLKADLLSRRITWSTSERDVCTIMQIISNLQASPVGTASSLPRNTIHPDHRLGLVPFNQKCLFWTNLNSPFLTSPNIEYWDWSILTSNYN